MKKIKDFTNIISKQCIDILCTFFDRTCMLYKKLQQLFVQKIQCMNIKQKIDDGIFLLKAKLPVRKHVFENHSRLIQWVITSIVIIWIIGIWVYYSPIIAPLDWLVFSTQSKQVQAWERLNYNEMLPDIKNIISSLQGVMTKNTERLQTPEFVDPWSFWEEHIPILLLHSMGIISDWQRYLDGSAYGTLKITRAEAIKILTLIHARTHGYKLSEVVFFDQQLPYNDLRRNARYMPYVLYAHEHWLLSSVIQSWSALRPMDLMTLREFHTILQSFWWDVVFDRSQQRSSDFVSKESFIDYVVQSFGWLLFDDFRILRWKNEQFYTLFLTDVFGKDLVEQQILLDETRETLRTADAWLLLEVFDYDLIGLRKIFLVLD